MASIQPRTPSQVTATQRGKVLLSPIYLIYIPYITFKQWVVLSEVEASHRTHCPHDTHFTDGMLVELVMVKAKVFQRTHELEILHW